jgi:hypothetical protein
MIYQKRRMLNFLFIDNKTFAFERHDVKPCESFQLLYIRAMVWPNVGGGPTGLHCHELGSPQRVVGKKIIGLHAWEDNSRMHDIDMALEIERFQTIPSFEPTCKAW